MASPGTSSPIGQDTGANGSLINTFVSVTLPTFSTVTAGDGAVGAVDSHIGKRNRAVVRDREGIGDLFADDECADRGLLVQADLWHLLDIGDLDIAVGMGDVKRICRHDRRCVAESASIHILLCHKIGSAARGDPAWVQRRGRTINRANPGSSTNMSMSVRFPEWVTTNE